MTEPVSNKSRFNPWPYAIIAWFVLFATGMAAWVVVAVRNDVDLVRDDYYEQEILFQQQIDRVARTGAAGQAGLDYDAAAKAITIQLPAGHARQHASGRIDLYRPSDARLDHQFTLVLNGDGVQQLDARALRPGLWKVRVQWKVNGEEFYFDRQIIIAGKS